MRTQGEKGQKKQSKYVKRVEINMMLLPRETKQHPVKRPCYTFYEGKNAKQKAKAKKSTQEEKGDKIGKKRNRHPPSSLEQRGNAGRKKRRQGSDGKRGSKEK